MYKFLFILTALVFSCKGSSSKSKLKEIPKTGIITTSIPPTIPTKLYSETKKSIVFLRKKAQIDYAKSIDKSEFLNEVSNAFTDYLLDSLIPYWYGTPWEFNGHTDVPNEGEVACGYFVSTTLKHMGLKLNRYKLAQQASMLEVQSIAIDQQNIFKLANPSKERLLKIPAGLYMVGLDNHVGYFLRKQNEAYFIHSDYVSGVVTKQKIENAAAFNSQVYYFTPISGNLNLMRYWMEGRRIPIHLK